MFALLPLIVTATVPGTVKGSRSPRIVGAWTTFGVASGVNCPVTFIAGLAGYHLRPEKFLRSGALWSRTRIASRGPLKCRKNEVLLKVIKSAGRLFSERRSGPSFTGWPL